MACMTMMQFTFDIPFKFERVCNFNRSELILNDYWFVEDSNPKFIKALKNSVKKTLVKRLEISLISNGDKCSKKYLVTLTGVTDSNDIFYVPAHLLPNFLKEFDLL